MSHGTPDYGLTAGARTTFRWADLDELGVRLGSPVAFDRRGDALVVESWEDPPTGWLLNAIGVGASCTRSLQSSKHGVYSLRMVAGSTSFRRAWAERVLAYQVASRFGLEASFTLHANLQEFAMAIYLYTGSFVWYVYGRYLHTTGEVQIRVPPATWVTVHTLVNPIVNSRVYHSWKLVGDPEAGCYVRHIFNDHAADLSDYELARDISSVSPQLYSHVGVTSIPLNNATVYTDVVVVTQNEPP